MTDVRKCDQVPLHGMEAMKYCQQQRGQAHENWYRQHPAYLVMLYFEWKFNMWR